MTSSRWLLVLLELALLQGLAQAVDPLAPGEAEAAKAPATKEPSPAPAELSAAAREEFEKLLGQLDAPDFARRRLATERLDALAAQEDIAAPLSTEIQRRLSLPQTSFEVRSVLQSLGSRLPASTAAPTAALTEEEIKSTVAELVGDHYSARLAAQQRLQGLLPRPKEAAVAFCELKRRFADPTLAVADRRLIEPVLDAFRGAWLLSKGEPWPLDEVNAEQIRQWLNHLADSTLSPAVHQIARQELLDLAARDEYRDRLLAAIAETARKHPDDEDAQERLESVREWFDPAMVAEIWQEYRQLTVQYLRPGVPQFPEMALRATFFDRIDDKTAHCVSGNQLVPADYPVGVAIPHPEGEARTFHLINLPTPRRRMAYQHNLQRSEATRLRELSQRTVDKILADKPKLTELDILMLVQLDRHVLSRSAGQLLTGLEDAPTPSLTGRLPTQSVLDGICFVLAATGTKEAVPAIDEAIAKGRIALPDVADPYHMARIATLAISQRDPWPGMEDWLAKLIESDEVLVANVDPAPELGATAAGMLLSRYEISPPNWGVEMVNEALLQRAGLTPRRFDSAERRAAVLDWWKRTKPRDKG